MGSSPEYYDILYGGVRWDIALFQSRISKSAHILEVAAGTGRISIPLAKYNRSIVASDVSTTMTEHLNRRAQMLKLRSFDVLCCDMRFLPFRSALFDTVICAFGSINYVLSSAERVRALREMRTVIKSDGTVWVDVNGDAVLPKEARDSVGKVAEMTEIYTAAGERVCYSVSQLVAPTESLAIRTFSTSRESVSFSWHCARISVAEFTVEADAAGLEILSISPWGGADDPDSWLFELKPKNRVRGR